jgi:hypothetical protein
MPDRTKTEHFCGENCKYKEYLSGGLKTVEYCRILERVLKNGLREGRHCAVAPKDCPFLSKETI